MGIKKYIAYQVNNKESKNWFRFLFDMGKAGTMLQLFWSAILVGVYTFALIYVKEVVFENDAKITPTIHSMLGITLGLLLVFRTNTAYDRWWEGRKLAGALTNTCRNLAIKLDTVLPQGDEDLRQRFASLISSYCYALKEHLRKGIKWNELEDLTEEDIARFSKNFHVPNQIAKQLYMELTAVYRAKNIDGFQHIAVERLIHDLTDIIGACERIKKTPMPKAYSIHLKLFILVYVATLPFGLSHELHFWTVPATMLIFYAMVGIEFIGEEIEEPFGEDDYDLPMDAICQNIRHNVFELLDPKSCQQAR